MSFYDDASLVVIPSAQKTSKLYAVKPTDGSGDLTFTRTGDTATRVNSAGLIEKVRTNLVLRSEAFDNASWTKSGVGTFTSAITTGFTDPTGGTNAQRWLATIASVSDRAFVRQLATLTNGIPYAISFWVKSNTGSSQDIYFMFQGGAVQATTVTTSWQRISYSATTTTTSVLVGIEAKNLAIDVLIYGFQLESGDIITDYIPTTTAAVSVGPVANVPRLDYLGSTCPRLLLEPQRTNLQLNSEDFSQANWSKTNTTIVVNQLASPDGFVNADKLNETAVNNLHQLESSRSVSASTVYTMSVFAKKAERSFVRIYEDTTSNSAYFNLDSGTTGTISGPTATAKIENYGNGWYRCSVTYTETGTFGRYRITIAKQDNEASYLGVAGSGIYVWGAQYEAGAYATSYIPTLAASATRGEDACSKTGISSLIGQTEGTIFLDLVWDNSFQDVVPLDVTGSNGKLIWFRGIGVQFYGDGTTLLADLSVPGAVEGTRYKLAFIYGANDFKLYRNGALVATDTSGTFSSGFSAIALNSVINQANLFNQVLFFPTKLTNAELITLTTL